VWWLSLCPSRTSVADHYCFDEKENACIHIFAYTLMYTQFKKIKNLLFKKKELDKSHVLYIGFYLLRMLSKPMYPYGKELENKFIKDCQKEDVVVNDLFTYKNYKIDQNLKKFKVNQLKDIAKCHKIPITATKGILIEKLD
jgi:hypothetical protein